MRRRQFISSSLQPMIVASLFVAAIGLALGPLASADDSREKPPPRPLPAESRAPSPSPPPPPPSSPPPSNPGVGAPPPSAGSGGGGRRHSRAHHPYPYYRHHFGFYGHGYYWPYSRFYRDYRRPYYPWGMVWYPAYSSDTRLAALDLEVDPWRVEVYVDGEYVGKAGKFDGYPGYLWLSEGSHQLVFHRPGWETVERRVTVRSGPVRTINLTLREGPTTPPEELFEATRVARASRGDQAPSKPGLEVERPAGRGERPERAESAELDLRGEPGRFRLEVEPRDASVYLDGRFLGSAEELSRLHAGMMVDAGEHVLEIQRPGYESESVRFQVEGGDETEVVVDLSSAETPGEGD